MSIIIIANLIQFREKLEALLYNSFKKTTEDEEFVITITDCNTGYPTNKSYYYDIFMAFNALYLKKEIYMSKYNVTIDQNHNSNSHFIRIEFLNKEDNSKVIVMTLNRYKNTQ